MADLPGLGDYSSSAFGDISGGGAASIGTDAAAGAAGGPWGLLLGGGLGLTKYLLDKQNAAKQQQLQAAIARYSPWTGMKAQPVSPINPAGDLLTGAGTGAEIQQQMTLNNALANRLNAGLYTGPDTGIVGSGAGGIFKGGKSALSVGDPASQDEAGNYHSQTPQYASNFNPLTGGTLGTSKWLTDNPWAMG